MEDPIEYKLKGLNQSQIDPSKGYTFADGLKSILRQDPDIVMVGEIRDLETANVAINAALTGHLMISTIHTNSAAGAIPRFLDMGVEPFLLGSTLNLIIAQRLIRKVCEKCKEEYSVPEEALAKIKASIGKVKPEFRYPGVDLNNMKFVRGKGCNHCGQTGYKGRLAIAEVITVNKNIKNICHWI